MTISILIDSSPAGFGLLAVYCVACAAICLYAFGMAIASVLPRRLRRQISN